MNGKNGAACITYFGAVNRPLKIVVRPLLRFRVRDLVVWDDSTLAQRFKPYLMGKIRTGS